MATSRPVQITVEVEISVAKGKIGYTVNPAAAFRGGYSIYVHRGTKMVWICTCPCAVVFNGPSPLNVPYVVGAAGSRVTTRVRRNATSGAYKFTTVAASKGKILADDPEIIVD